MTDRLPNRPAGASRWAAILVIAATYFYFLIFAEFAFLELAREVAPTAGKLRLIMLGLGIGGVLGGVGAAFCFHSRRGHTLLAWALRACAASGLVALTASSFLMAEAAAVLTGFSLGALTVILATMLSGAMGRAQLGLGIGVGTGVAYALCNLPWIFHAVPARQTILAVVAVLAASFLPRCFAPTDSEAITSPETRRSDVACWTLILLVLVWMDSAAFYIVQHTPALRAATWSDSNTLYTNAAVHLVAAVIAGVALDHGRRAFIASAAIVALAIAAFVLNGVLPTWMSANGFYTAGVSLYSVVLVEFPARTARPMVAALVFAVAGWVGSAFGIGMVQDLARSPNGFIVAAAVAVLLALSARSRFVARGMIASVATIGAVRGDDIALGREVYIGEGCIHCHSQYIRPRVATEVLNWGPATPLREALAAAPPLFGTRRQGPDLSHVGNRRSWEWNRLHLIAPQTISPGSRMPSYAYLFEDKDGRGDALLAYLASLGGETGEQRQKQIASWQPHASEVTDAKTASKLFRRMCAQCHGETGRGDGNVAGRLSVMPPDWNTMPWRHVRASDEVEIALSRIIKFGLPGLPMAGHEYLSDAEIVGLARHVRTLHKAGCSASPAAVQP
jgi:cbb3-type cytochrome oxidase cytochrome c subunit